MAVLLMSSLALPGGWSGNTFYYDTAKNNLGQLRIKINAILEGGVIAREPKRVGLDKSASISPFNP